LIVHLFERGKEIERGLRPLSADYSLITLTLTSSIKGEGKVDSSFRWNDVIYGEFRRGHDPSCFFSPSPARETLVYSDETGWRGGKGVR
jgi:hypothetical protein